MKLYVYVMKKKNVKIYSGNYLLRATSLTPWSKFFSTELYSCRDFQQISRCLCNEIPPPRVSISRSTATYAEHYLYRILRISVSHSLQIHLKRDLFPSRFQTKRLYAFLNFQMPGCDDPALSTTMRDFRLSEMLFKTQPSVTSICVLSNTKLNPFHDVFTASSRKIHVTYVRIDEDFGGISLFVSLIHGNFCCSVHVLYVCVADPRKLLL
jgi:hypothetical protein